jgi:hypothetical protein
VTKRFRRFKKEHAAFLKFITGITGTDRDWYASVMLNRDVRLLHPA